MSYDTEQATMPRPDGRDVYDQFHNRASYVDGVKTPDATGNVVLPVRSHDLAEWLLSQPDMAICVEDGTVGPEGADCVLFETMTAYDDPDPYSIIVARPYPKDHR